MDGIIPGTVVGVEGPGLYMVEYRTTMPSHFSQTVNEGIWRELRSSDTLTDRERFVEDDYFNG